MKRSDEDEQHEDGLDLVVIMMSQVLRMLRMLLVVQTDYRL